MAMMLQKLRARAHGPCLYVWTIPLGVSDLAAGLAWLAIFNRPGLLQQLLSSAWAGGRPGGLAELHTTQWRCLLP